MDQCVDILQSHPEALPSDQEAIWWVKLAFIMEDASMQLSDDTESISSFSDSKVRYTIKGFANQLAQWKRDIPDATYSGEYIEATSWLDSCLSSFRSSGPYLPRAKSLCP